ncbi:MAG TPA: hypothetical protein VHB21_22375, partial [Minicystis sp.]|nr:hypothetical protein [Minicystis sp.]
FARPAVVPSARKEPPVAAGAAAAPTTSAADWEGDDAPTRVADASLRFPGRPQRGATEAREAAKTDGPNPDASVRVEPHWDEEDDEETLALGGNASGDAASKRPIVDFDDEATEVIAPDRARELLAAESSKHPTSAPPKLSFGSDDEDATQIIAEDRAEALLAAQVAPRPSDAPPLPEGPNAPLPRPPAVPDAGAPRAAGPGRAPPVPSRPPRQPPRPRPLSAEPNTPLDVAGVPPVAEKSHPPTPKPAAGTPPLASLAPPKPSSAPPAAATPVAPPPAEPERPAEPTIVVAESKPVRPPETALATMPRQRPPSPPAASLRTMQNEPTRVVRVVSKGPGFAFWFVLILALAAAAAGGFVVSQMLRDRGAPSWLKKP